MHIFKQKGFIYLVVFVAVIGGFTWYYFYKKNFKLLKTQLISWVNSDVNVESRAKRIAGINMMPYSELKILSKLVNEYFNTNTSVPVDLKKFWDYAVNKYGIGG